MCSLFFFLLCLCPSPLRALCFFFCYLRGDRPLTIIMLTLRGLLAVFLLLFAVCTAAAALPPRALFFLLRRLFWGTTHGFWRTKRTVSSRDGSSGPHPSAYVRTCTHPRGGGRFYTISLIVSFFVGGRVRRTYVK